MDNKRLIKLHVTGKVQGVWFRQSTKSFALEHAITGYAKNLADGSVEVLAIGQAADLSTLKDYLHHGPEHALVDSVQVILMSDLSNSEDLIGASLTDFETL